MAERIGNLLGRLGPLKAAQAAAGAVPVSAPPPTRGEALAASWAGLVPSRFTDATVASLPEAPWRDHLAAWADDRAATNVVILGPTGSGKTWAAAAVCRRRFGRHRDRPAWWTVTTLLDHLRPGGDPDRSTWNTAVAAPVLVLDDIGAQRDTEWADERLYALIAERWAEERPVIATSNMTPDQARERLDPRVYSRLFGGALVVAVTGPDRRMTP